MACQGAAEGFVWGLACRRCSGDLSQGTTAEAAGAAVAEFEADAEEARCRAEGSVAAVVAAANGREAAHSVVVGRPVVEGNAEAEAADLGLEETKAAEGTIDRLAEAQSTVVGHVAGLSCISAMLAIVSAKMTHRIRPSLEVLEHISLCQRNVCMRNSRG